MKKHMAVLSLMVALVLSLPAVPAGAWDTSPYLVGTLDGDFYGNGYFIINPTTQQLRVYGAGFYDGTMGPCAWTTIPPNGTFYVAVQGGPFVGAVMKFFAFPLSGKFDPNAVIGGFQQKFSTDYWNDTCQVTEANLKAVTVNSYTIGEFDMIKQAECLPYDPNQVQQLPQPWPWPMAGACVYANMGPSIPPGDN
jgi:hypothetical protein